GQGVAERAVHGTPSGTWAAGRSHTDRGRVKARASRPGAELPQPSLVSCGREVPEVVRAEEQCHDAERAGGGDGGGPGGGGRGGGGAGAGQGAPRAARWTPPRG